MPARGSISFRWNSLIKNLYPSVFLPQDFDVFFFAWWNGNGCRWRFDIVLFYGWIQTIKNKIKTKIIVTLRLELQINLFFNLIKTNGRLFSSIFRRCAKTMCHRWCNLEHIAILAPVVNTFTKWICFFVHRVFSLSSAPSWKREGAKKRRNFWARNLALLRSREYICK